MNKTFNLYSGFLMNPPDLPQRKLSCRHDPGYSCFSKKGGSFWSCNRHLGAGMDRQPWKLFFQKGQYSKILDNNPICPLFIKGCQEIIKLSIKLPVLQKRIHCKIDLFPMDMGKINGFFHLIPVRIVCVGPGSEQTAADIYGICPGPYHSLQSLIGTCRSQ